jgi:benzoyl-CoA reductase/2-hydroxyglutaryl-CoA dehydratase subunit BcrC/BadD/HgdB
MSLENDEGEESDLESMRRWIPVGKALMKFFLHPLLRFDSLINTTKKRAAIELLTAQSTDADFMWMQARSGIIKQYVKGAISSENRDGRPLVWVAWCVATDLVLAFDAQPFCPEFWSVFGQFLGDRAERVIDFGEQAGVAPEHCSASKNALGGWISNQIPAPDCVVTSSHPCDSMVSSYQSLEYMTGAPTFMLDTPNWKNERALDYYAGEIGRLIEFLEEHLDRKLDYDRLREVLTEVNQTNELLMEIREMYRAVPCPATNISGAVHWLFRILGLGTPEVTEIARRLHRITKDRLDAGKGVIKKEKIRVLWFDVPVVFYPIQVWMEETFGAVTIIDLCNYVNTPLIDTSTPESMVQGMAQTYININMARQFHGPVDYYQAELARICEEYSGDCFIMPGHAGCKHNWAVTRLLKNYMKKIDMPLLILTSDIFDQRVTNEDQLKTQIEEFFLANGLA